MREAKAQVTLTSAESKRLIAKAVARLPEVTGALGRGTVVIAGGTTNAYVAEEILGETVPKERYTAGIVTDGLLCVTPPELRYPPIILKAGKRVSISLQEALESFGPDDVFIKGANAIDPQGFAGVIVANPTSGTIGAALPIIAARGSHLVVPCGLEKLIPSVVAAARVTGIDTFDYSLGTPVGMMPLVNARVITEIEAIRVLAGASATHVASGGVGGSEGSVTLVIHGESEDVRTAFELIKAIKGEPGIPALRRECASCKSQCVLAGQ